MARKLNDITAYRRKRKLKGLAVKLAVLALFVIAAAIVYANRVGISENLHGLGGRIMNNADVSPGEGFPIKLPGSARYDVGAINQRFALLTDTYINLYRSSGKKIYSLQHGFSNPVFKTNDYRILLFDHNASGYSVYNFNSKLFGGEAGDEENADGKGKIIAAEIGADNYVAIASTSEKYANTVSVYDDGNAKIYIKRFADEYTDSLSFADEPNELVIAASGISGGDIVSRVYKVNFTTEDDYVWERDLPVNTIVLKTKAAKGRVSVLCDDRFISLDTKTGDIKGEYVFSSDIKRCVLGENFSLLFLTDYIAGNSVLLSLDKNAGVISTFNITDNLRTFEIFGDEAYVLDGNILFVYDKFAEEKKKITLPDGEYTKMVKTGPKLILLGYDDITEVDIENNTVNGKPQQI